MRESDDNPFGHDDALISWNVPSTHLDALYGDGATRVEKALPTVTGLVGVIGVATYAWTAQLPWAREEPYRPEASSI